VSTAFVFRSLSLGSVIAASVGPVVKAGRRVSPRQATYFFADAKKSKQKWLSPAGGISVAVKRGLRSNALPIARSETFCRRKPVMDLCQVN